jgi:hypothetical protein
MGRRRPVEVPRRRLARRLGGARGRRTRHAGVREHALRPGRPHTSSWRCFRRGDPRAPDRVGRRARRSPGRGRRPGRPGGVVHGPALLRVGGRENRRVLRGAGEHPRLGRNGRRAGGDVRGEPGPAPRRAPARLSRRRSAGGRRPPGPAIGRSPRRPKGRRVRGAERRPRRSPGRRSPDADCRTRAPLRSPPALLRPDAYP